MCGYNKKWHITEPLFDFDAVSLYLSAKDGLKVIQGIPKVIPSDKLNLEFLKTTDAYVIEIKILSVEKHYPFPLIVQKIKGLNLNDDNIIEPVIMVVDNITLEDLIEFQKIKFEIIKGYYWNEGSDIKIQKVIRNLFNKRVEYKKQKNPLQNLYKLIMNSCYGKTIEKPINKDWKYIKGHEEADNYAIKNYIRIVDHIKLNNSDIEAFRVKRPIDQHFNFSLLGIQVLSMSKRIMNEVMCLAYDIGCKIYYQDTDSMHIRVQDLEKLQNEFKKKYNRELVGSNLGQFHSDFTSNEN